MRNFKTKLTMMGVGAALLSTLSTPADAGCSGTIYTGSVCFMAADYCPRGYIQAGGQMIGVNDQPALFALLGGNYGGDARTIMGIPDLRGRAPVGDGLGPGMAKDITLGLKRGVQIATLTLAQLAQHSHSYDLSNLSVTGKIKASTTTGGLGNPAGNYLSQSSQTKAKQFKKSGSTTPMLSPTVTGSINGSSISQTTATGLGQAFPNQGPRLGLTACVADSTNLFPPRS